MSTELPSFLLDHNAVLNETNNDIKWRNSLPNYDKVNKLFEGHKTTNHSIGSLEYLVQNLVQNWEKGKTL